MQKERWPISKVGSFPLSHLHNRTCHDRSSLQKFNIFEVTKPFIQKKGFRQKERFFPISNLIFMLFNNIERRFKGPGMNK